MEVVAQRRSAKKVFLKILQNSEENTCARASFLIKLQALGPATLNEKRLQHSCSLANFSEILTSTYFEEHLQTAASVMNSYIVKQGSVTDIFLRFFQNI